MQLVFLSIVLLLICIVLCVFQNKILFKLKLTCVCFPPISKLTWERNVSCSESHICKPGAHKYPSQQFPPNGTENDSVMRWCTYIQELETLLFFNCPALTTHLLIFTRLTRIFRSIMIRTIITCFALNS